MKINNQILIIFVIFAVDGKRIRKRQIYREQVQPHTGGKIPDSAFETDRLWLNRLQKEGIAVPDGIVLEQRNPKVFPYSHNDLRPVFKVYATSDSNDSGENFQFVHPVIETTYPIPRIAEDQLEQIPIHTTTYQPIIRPLFIPNLFRQNSDHEPLPLQDTYDPYTNLHQFSQSPLTVTNFGNVNPKSQLTRSSITHFYEDYISSQIFSDISTFFDRLGYDIPFGVPLS